MGPSIGPRFEVGRMQYGRARGRLVFENPHIFERTCVVRCSRVFVVDDHKKHATAGIELTDRNSEGHEVAEIGNRVLVRHLKRATPILRSEDLEDPRIVGQSIVLIESDAVDLALGRAHELELDDREWRDGKALGGTTPAIASHEKRRSAVAHLDGAAGILVGVGHRGNDAPVDTVRALSGALLNGDRYRIGSR